MDLTSLQKEPQTQCSDPAAIATKELTLCNLCKLQGTRSFNGTLVLFREGSKPKKKFAPAPARLAFGRADAPACAPVLAYLGPNSAAFAGRAGSLSADIITGAIVCLGFLTGMLSIRTAFSKRTSWFST